MTQLCLDEGIACHFIHASEELALSFVESLGLGTNPLDKMGDGADDSGVGADVQLELEVDSSVMEGDVVNNGVKDNGACVDVIERDNGVGDGEAKLAVVNEKGVIGRVGEVGIEGENGTKTGRAKGGVGTRRSSRRRGAGNAYEDMSTQSFLDVLSEAEKGIEADGCSETEKGTAAEKSTEKGGRLGMGKLSK